MLFSKCDTAIYYTMTDGIHLQEMMILEHPQRIWMSHFFQVGMINPKDNAMVWSQMGHCGWQIMKTTTRFALSPAGLISQHWHHNTNNHMAAGNRSDWRRKSVQCVIITLTMSLYSFSLVNQRASAHLRPLVTAVTPWGLIGPEEKPATRPQVGFTRAWRERSKIHHVEQIHLKKKIMKWIEVKVLDNHLLLLFWHPCSWRTTLHHQSCHSDRESHCGQKCNFNLGFV